MAIHIFALMLFVLLDLFDIFRRRAADAKQGNVITSDSGVCFCHNGGSLVFSLMITIFVE
jgi:hypothetical protein